MLEIAALIAAVAYALFVSGKLLETFRFLFLRPPHCTLPPELDADAAAVGLTPSDEASKTAAELNREALKLLKEVRADKNRFRSDDDPEFS